jgi:hypothetical protein
MIMNFPERFKVVPVMASDDINAGVDADSINMAKYHRAAFILTFGTLSGDAVLTVHSGAADGEKSSALTFYYALASAAIGSEDCDVLASDSTSASLTLTAATYTDKMLVVEIDAADMDVANSEEWLTLSLSDAAASGSCDVVAILEPRYSGACSVTALS